VQEGLKIEAQGGLEIVPQDCMETNPVHGGLEGELELCTFTRGRSGMANELQAWLEKNQVQEGLEDEMQEGLEGEMQEGLEGEMQEGLEDKMQERLEDEMQEGLRGEMQGLEGEMQGLMQDGLEDEIQEGLEGEMQE